jgi:biopolymer transport protein ExbD
MRLARPQKRRNTIVLTSLVDVMFVLLFFFMLVSNYGDWRSWSLGLAGDSEQTPSDVLIVQVLGDGRYKLGKSTVTLDVVEAALKVPSMRAVLVPAPGVTLQTLVDALDALKPTGAELTLGRAAQPAP